MLELNLQKNKVVRDKTLFFVKLLFVPLVLFVLTLAFLRTSLYGNIAFLIIVLSTKKMYSSFLKKVLVFRKNMFQSKSIENV